MSKTTAREDLQAGFWRQNPVFAMGLGLCPVLAVTNTLANGLTMAIATTFVLIGSSTLVSALKRWIPNEVRISAFILIIATFVTMVDLITAAVVPAIYATIGAFISLIVVNCMILGRAEAFANKNTVGRSLLDAIGTATGFTIALVLMSALREVLGSGTLLGYRVLGPSFEPWVIMVLPPGGFFTIGFYMLIFGWLHERKARRQGKLQKRHWIHPVTRDPELEGVRA